MYGVLDVKRLQGRENQLCNGREMLPAAVRERLKERDSKTRRMMTKGILR